MEVLIVKYGFNEEQVNNIIGSINDVIPCIVKEVGPSIAENYKQKLKTEAEEIEEISRKRKTALKYMQNNIQDWKNHLKIRSDKYNRILRCVSNLDLYTECLEVEPMYIPCKFRRDKTHYNTVEAKREIERMNYESLKSEMQILRISKEKFTRELQHKECTGHISNMKSKIKTFWKMFSKFGPQA